MDAQTHVWKAFYNLPTKGCGRWQEIIKAHEGSTVIVKNSLRKFISATLLYDTILNNMQSDNNNKYVNYIVSSNNDYKKRFFSCL